MKIVGKTCTKSLIRNVATWSVQGHLLGGKVLQNVMKMSLLIILCMKTYLQYLNVKLTAQKMREVCKDTPTQVLRSRMPLDNLRPTSC